MRHPARRARVSPYFNTLTIGTSQGPEKLFCTRLSEAEVGKSIYERGSEASEHSCLITRVDPVVSTCFGFGILKSEGRSATLREPGIDSLIAGRIGRLRVARHWTLERWRRLPTCSARRAPKAVVDR